MADDIASVGIKIETGDIDRANVSLDTLAGKGASVDKALASIEGAAKGTGAALGALGSNTKAASDNMGNVGQGAEKGARSVRALADSLNTAGKSAADFATGQARVFHLLSGGLTDVTKAESSYIRSLTDELQALKLTAVEREKYIAQSRGMSEGVQQVAVAMRQKIEALKQEQAATRESAQSSESLEGSFKAVKLAVGAVVGSQLVRWAKDAGGALFEASVNAERLRTMLNFSTGNSARDIEYLRGITQKLGLEMQSTATAYGQFAAAAKGTTLEGQKTRDVFESIAKASAVMGLSANQTSGVLLALQQMVSKGTVQAEELRGQLGERLPGAFQVAARAMGVTTGELGKMLEQGQVVADDFLPKFARALNEYVGDAAESAATRLEASQSRMSNAWERLMQAVGDSGISSAMAVGMESAASSIDAIAVAMEAARRSGDGMGGQLLAAAGAAYKLLDPVDRLTVNLYDNERASKAAWERLRDLEAQAARGVNVRAEYQQVINLINTLQIARHEMAKLRQEASGVANVGDRPRDLREDNPSMTRGASYARWAKEQADAEKGLAEVRMKAAGVNKSYFEDLGKWQAALRAGVIGEKEYIEQVSKLATETWKASAAGKEAAGSKRAGAKASNEAARAAEREAAAISNFMTSLREKIAAQELELQGGEKLTQADRLRLDFQSKLISGALKLTTAQKEKAEAEIKSFEANEKALKLQQEQARVYEQASKDYDKYVGTMVREAETLAQKNKAFEDEIEAMGLTGRALVDLERKRIDEQITALKAQHSTAVLAGARDDETAAIRRQIAELERYRELIGQRADKSAAVEEAKRAEEEWKRAADSINQSLTDALMRGFESGKGFASNFRDTLKNMFKTLVLKPIIQGVLAPVTGALGGMFGGPAAAGQGGSSLLSTASNANSLWSMFGGGTLNPIYNGLAALPGSVGYGMLPGMSVGSQQAAMLAAQTQGFGGAGIQATAGAAQYGGASWATAGAAAIALPLIVGALFEKFGNSNERITGAATTGTNRPSVNIGSGAYDMLTGNLPDRQALIDRLVGYGATAADLDKLNDRLLYKLTVNAGIEESFGREGGPNYNWRNWIKDNADLPDFYKGPGYANPEALGWWSNDYYNGKGGAVAGYNALYSDPAMVAASRQLAESIVQPFNLVSKALGETAEYAAAVGFAFDPDKKNNKWWAGMSIDRDGQSIVDFGRREGGGIDGAYKTQEDALRAMFKSALGAFNELDLPNWARTKVEATQAELDKLSGEKMGEEAAALYAQTTAGIEQMYRSIQMLIDVFPDFSATTQDSVFALQELMGGMDQLQGAYSSYLQNFWSDEERADLMRKQLGLELEKVGLSLPETRDAFRDLVEAQDLSTEAGREAFAALMNLSGSFAAVVPAVEEISSSTSEMGRAMGDAARATEDLAAMARKAEDEARRASERAAQDAAQAIVKAAQDAASAASEAARKASEAHSKASAMTDRVFAELRKQFDKALQAARTKVDTAQAIAQMTGERSRALYGEIPESRQYGAAAGNAFIDDALRTMLQGGAMPKTDELSRAIDSAVAGLDVNNYASVAQFQADKAILAAKLGAMEKVAGKQLTEGEQQVELLQQQLEHWDEQLSVLRDTQVSVTSIDDGVRQLSGLMAAESAAAGAAREAQDRYAQASLALQQAQQAQQGAAQQPGSIAGAYNSAVANIRAASWYGNGDWGEARGLKLSELSTAIGVDAGDLARLLVQQGLSLHGDLITTRDAYGDHDAEAAAIRAAKWFGSGNWDDARGSSLIGLAKSLGVDPVDLERRLIAEGMQVSADGIVLSKRYAQGGLHSGGWRLVGEQGPEVEFTGPARYWSFDQSRSMLSGGGGGNEELIAENRALRAKVDQLIARLDRVAAATETSARLMDRVTANGNAMRTEAA